MKEPSPRAKRLLAVHEALKAQSVRMEMDWPRSGLDDPMITGDKHTILRTRVHDTDAVKQGAAIIEAILADPDGYAVLMELRSKKRWAFDSCVLLAKEELAKADEAPPQDKAA
jgi:hypothetical protein